MEIKQLSGFVLLLVMVGMILGVGVLVLDSFGDATQEETTAAHENITIAAGTGTTTFEDVVSVSWFGNQTQNKTTDFNIVGSEVNWTAAGVFTCDGTNFTDHWYEVTYVYDENQSSTDSIADVRQAITPIATTWMSLIVTVVILSIILTLVIRSFTFRRR